MQPDIYVGSVVSPPLTPAQPDFLLLCFCTNRSVEHTPSLHRNSHTLCFTAPSGCREGRVCEPINTSYP
ncbi:hypothetical protein GN956_G24363 [Arapaima gigas]